MTTVQAGYPLPARTPGCRDQEWRGNQANDEGNAPGPAGALRIKCVRKDAR